MTETRTPRFNLPQWSSGSDAPSRDDFNGAFSDIEARGGYDAGDSAATLPVTNLVAGRSTQITTASDGYTMYRYNGSVWQYTGGTLIPVATKYKALQGQALTGTAFTVEHPSRTTAGLTATYGGDLTTAGVLRSFDTDDDARGVGVFGWDGTPDLGTHGRLYVRTRRTGDLGMVVQSHAAGAGNLLTVREPGGQDIFTVDSTGRLTQRTYAAFGGASIPTQSVLAVAPTSSDVDGITNGLLLYGQASAPTKVILRIQPDNTADLTPIAVYLRDRIGLGRLPWGTPGTSTGTITYAANTHHFRASGHASNTSYFTLRKSDVTSSATELDTTKDLSLLTVSNTGIGVQLPMFISQRQRPTSATMALYRVTDFNAPFLDLARLVPDGVGGETSQSASTWDSQGRLRTGVWWKGTGFTREARQPVTHVSSKRYTPVGTTWNNGQFVARNTAYEYTWPTMAIRSSSTTDLDITTTAELQLTHNPDGVDDAQNIIVETYVQVDNGPFQFLASSENIPVTPSLVHRPGGDLMVCNHRTSSIGTGATFRIRTRVLVGPSVPELYLRMLDLKIQEICIEVYAAP